MAATVGIADVLENARIARAISGHRIVPENCEEHNYCRDAEFTVCKHTG